MTDQTCPLDAQLFKQSLNCLREEPQCIGPTGLGGLPKAGEVDGNRPGVRLEGSERSSPGLGKASKPVDQQGNGAVPSGDVVQVEAIHLSASEPDPSHVGSS